MTKTISTELAIAHRIISNGLKAGYSVSVFDGEEWCLKRSTKRDEIYAALASTDTDQIRFRNAAGESVGTVLLVWGNDEDVVGDCTDNEAISALIGPNSDGRI
jgi:hypothetical protein